jgi:hypothetical protein
MRRITTIALLALAALASAQEGQNVGSDANQTKVDTDVKTTAGKVTIASRGSDVRPVLFDLFTQSQKNFVLEPNLHFVLYLSLAGVEFDEALEIVCNLAGLGYQIDNGIYFIGKKKVGGVAGFVTNAEPKPTTPPTTAKKGKLTESELNKRLTTRLTVTAITDVFKSFTQQTGIEILVDKDVPVYRIDAYLIDTSLQYALDVIMRSTGLKYTLTDDKQVRVSKK